jgi:hypothetical protein
MSKFKYAIIATFLGAFLVGGAYSLGATQTHQAAVQGVQPEVPAATQTPTPLPTDTPTPTPYIVPAQSGLSNDRYYTNSDGNQVHSPAYSTDNSVPVGATALCADGTYSFSQHRSGTCSHHGGVLQRL